jgi:hypothetical protein
MVDAGALELEDRAGFIASASRVPIISFSANSLIRFLYHTTSPPVMTPRTNRSMVKSSCRLGGPASEMPATMVSKWYASEELGSPVRGRPVLLTV